MDERWHAEFLARQERCRIVATERGFDGLLVVGRSPDRANDVKYLVNHRPLLPGHVSRFTFKGRGMAAVLLGLDGEPVLITSTGFLEQELAVERIRVSADWPREVAAAVRAEGLERAVLGLVGIDVIPLGLYWELEKELPHVRFRPADDIVMNMRAVKSSLELEILRAGALIADEVLAEVVPQIEPGRTEKEILRLITSGLESRGVENPSGTFQSGVERSGEPIMHQRATERRLEEGDMYHMEVNGSYRGYMIDVCRSGVVGKAGLGQVEFLEVVLEMLEASVAAIKPGIRAEELQSVAASVADHAGLLCHHTLAYGGPGTYLGHGIGLGIDEPPLLALGDKTPLRSGMVLTLEPGLYRTPYGGARIEDEVLVTSSGAEVLNRYPRRLW
jgi:Xaa-Pro aminopeptidase